MFRTFARLLGPSAEHQLFLYHPADLTAVLELAWDRRPNSDRDGSLGRPLHRSDLTRFRDSWFGRPALTSPAPTPPTPPPPPPPPPLQPDLNTLINAIVGRRLEPVLWDHLIYAYMIENTRIYDIFRQVVYEFAHGERLGPPTRETQQWLRNTEELFYREAPTFFVSAVQSEVRPNRGATHRNAYQRLLGLDLNHGAPDNTPYAYVRAEAANKEFVSIFEELLREAWVGIINASNSSGTKATDNAKLLDLVTKLNDMLMARRLYGNLSREEFTIVATMSWFHQTVASDSPVVQDLRAQAASPEQRLFKIAQRVGVPAHGLSGSYFTIAERISRLLLLIEYGVFTASNIAALYTPGTGIEALVRDVVTQWTFISGHDLKAARTAPNDMTRSPA